MTQYTDRDSLMAALAPLDPSGRAELLYADNNRSLVTSYGANVTFYHGNIKEGNCWEERFGGITLSLIQRKNTKSQPDGIGALGGRTDEIDHEGLSDALDITKVTVARELKEETAGMGIDITNLGFDKSKLVHVDLPVRDDAYLLRNRRGTAVDPHCYLYKLEVLLPTLPNIPVSKKEDEGKLTELPLFEALMRYGKGDLNSDYRYPHEYFVTWKIASDEIGNSESKPAKMIKLATEVQTAIFAKGEDYRIDFESIAKIMDAKLADMDKALGLPEGTVRTMQSAINDISRDEVLTKPR